MRVKGTERRRVEMRMKRMGDLYDLRTPHDGWVTEQNRGREGEYGEYGEMVSSKGVSGGDAWKRGWRDKYGVAESR